MNLLMFIGACAASFFTFHLLEAAAFDGQKNSGRLQGIVSASAEDRQRHSSWAVFLSVFLPTYFQVGKSPARRDLVDLLRRAGYPYPTTGVFFAGAIRTFSLFLLTGGILAGLLLASGTSFMVCVALAAGFIVLGLRRPYTRMKLIIRRRSAGVRSNMLTGLAILNALLSAGVGVQESLRRSASIGGPFCNLLGLLVAQMEVVPFLKAVEVVEAHVPDPDDVEMRLFLRSVRSFYNRNRPLLPAVKGLQTAVHRDVLEATEARAALVRQRSGLFGVFAVLGLVISIIAPFVGALG